MASGLYSAELMRGWMLCQEACLLKKAYKHDIRDVVSARRQRFLLFFSFSAKQKHEFVGLKCILKQGFQLSKSTFSPRFLAHKGTAEIAKIAHFIEKFGTFRSADFQKSNKSNKSNKQNRETKFVSYI